MGAKERIVFNSQKSSVILDYTSKPFFEIIRINCSIADKNWAPRLFDAQLLVKITGSNENDKLKSSIEDIISIGAQISPYHKQPVFDINRLFSFSNKPSESNDRSYSNWTLELTLLNLNFENNDNLTIEYMDTNYIQRRVEDWDKRIKDLFQTIKSWLDNERRFSLKVSKEQKMLEELMITFGVSEKKIETADICYDNKIILSIKPYGLWIIGGNGRIDLLSSKGNNILVDTAEIFCKPEWKLFFVNQTNKALPFNSETLFRLINP